MRRFNMRLAPGFIAALVLAIFACPGESLAADKNWTTAVSGNFADGTKWTPAGGPSFDANAIFNVPGTYTVTNGDFIQISELHMLQGNVTLNSEGGGGFLLLPVVPDAGISIGANSGTSSLIFDGASSEFTTEQFDGYDSNGIYFKTSPNISLGGGGAGILTFKNGAVANLRSGVLVGGSGSLNVLSGAIVQANGIVAGNLGGTGIVTVDGIGSQLFVDVDLETYVSGYVAVPAYCTVYSNGTVNIDHSGAMRVDNNLIIGGMVNVGASAAATLLADSTVSINNGGTLNLYHGSGFSAYGGTTVSSGGVMDYIGGGTLTSNVDLQTSGTLKTEGAGADLSVQGGSISVDGGLLQVVHSLNVANILTVNSGTANVGADLAVSFGGNMAVNGGAANVTANLSANQGGTISVNGGQVNVTGSLNLGSSGSGSLDLNDVINFGGTGDGVVAIAGSLNIAHDSVTNGTGNFSIDNGALSAHDIHLGDGGLAGQSGTIDVFGGSVTQTAGGVFTIGAAANSTAALNVHKGTFTAGAGTVLNTTGVITVSNGVANLGAVTQNGGYIDFPGGTLLLQTATDAVINPQNGLFRTNILTLYGPVDTPLISHVRNDLELVGTLRVDPTSALVMSGGLLNASALTVKGTMELDTGSVTANGAGGLTIGDGGPVGAGVTMGPSNLALLTVTNTATVNANSQLLVNGGRFTGGTLSVLGNTTMNGGNLSLGAANISSGANLNVFGGTLSTASLTNSGTALLQSTSSTASAGFTNQASGLLVLNTAATLVANGSSSNAGELNFTSTTANLNGTGTLTNTGLIHGNGIIAKPVTNDFGGELRAESGQRLKLTGASGTSNGKINLQGGTAEFSQALTNGGTGQIVGRGTLITGGTGLTNTGNVALSAGITDVFGKVNNNTGSASKGISIAGNANVTFWDDVTNTSGLFKVNAGSTATFFGSFSGNGISGNASDIDFESDISPGFSPASITLAGNVSLGAAARLNIELGGTAPGTQYDQVHVTGQLSLDGILTVALINSFKPAAGNSFDILDWSPLPGSLSGMFSAIQLPALAGGLVWNTNQLYVTGVLTVGGLPGDYNGNGAVDAADYVMSRKNDGTQGGYDNWRENFGQTAAGSGSGLNADAAVPEPATLVLLIIAAAVWCLRRGLAA